MHLEESLMTGSITIPGLLISKDWPFVIASKMETTAVLIFPDIFKFNFY